jgi:hypothetical protein
MGLKNQGSELGQAQQKKTNNFKTQLEGVIMLNATFINSSVIS